MGVSGLYVRTGASLMVHRLLISGDVDHICPTIQQLHGELRIYRKWPVLRSAAADMFSQFCIFCCTLLSI